VPVPEKNDGIEAQCHRLAAGDHRRLHILLAFDEDGLDVPALRADGDDDLVAADTGIPGGILSD